MISRERAEEIFAEGVKVRTDDGREFWETHSRGVAKVAEGIARKAGMDAEKAYVMGLMHDIGKAYDQSMNHVFLGYQKMMEEGAPEVAKICLTHSFNPKEKVVVLDLLNDADEKFVKDFVANSEYDDYDLLIQLADFMSGAHGITTVERRFCSVLVRHNLPDAREELSILYQLKQYFNQKCGGDVYELFHDEIARAPFCGVPGNYNVKEDL